MSEGALVVECWGFLLRLVMLGVAVLVGARRWWWWGSVWSLQMGLGSGRLVVEEAVPLMAERSIEKVEEDGRKVVEGGGGREWVAEEGVGVRLVALDGGLGVRFLGGGVAEGVMDGGALRWRCWIGGSKWLGGVAKMAAKTDFVRLQRQAAFSANLRREASLEVMGRELQSLLGLWRKWLAMS